MNNDLNEKKTNVSIEQPKTVEDIQAWLVNYFVEILEIPAEEIDREVNFEDYGLDSEVAITLTGDLEEWLGKKINPTLVYNYTNIESISKYLGKDN